MPQKWDYRWHQSKKRRDDLKVAIVFGLLLAGAVVGTLLLARLP